MTSTFSIRGLVKKYSDFQLGPLNLDLEPGTVLGYVGPNGSGKTTTLHCLMGLVTADSGEIEICGRAQHSLDTGWRTDIGYVGDQQVFYEHWSGGRNLRFLSQFYPQWSDRTASELAARLSLPLDKPAKDLSSGNRVKLSLVAAFAHSPRLLLLDEPTSGLDPVARAELLDVLFDYMRDGERAIFYSTHILADISRLADELAFLDGGRIKVRQSKEDLTDQWRRISFRTAGERLNLVAVARHRHEGRQHQVITFDRETMLRQLGELGVEDVEEQRMGIDEIAVEIMRGANDVANS